MVMPIHHLEHFLLQCADIEATADWYVRVLGLRDGDHPDFKIPVKWLYAEDRDVIHITEGGASVSENRMKYLGQQSTALEGTGVIDHVAFRTTGLKDMMARLHQEKVKYTTRRADDQALFQIFLFDPNGVKIELNFAAAEAVGMEAQLSAASLT
jgi:catechol 2,3-dioxygenase-like lactoylglutathione lyase family enzyme